MNSSPEAVNVSPREGRRWPLHRQIMLPFTGLMLATILAVTLLTSYIAARRVERQIEEQLVAMARVLIQSSFPLSDAVLVQMRGLSGAEFVLAERGTILAASLPIHKASLPEVAPVDRPEQLRLGPPVLLGGAADSRGRYFSMAMRMPESRPGRQRVLYILYPEQVWQDARWHAVYPLQWVGLAALAAIAVVSMWLARRVTKPIVRVQGAVGRLAAGEFEPLPMPPRNDELRDLVQSINQLAQQLDDMRQTIRRGERLALMGQLSGGLAHHLRNDVAGARMAVQLHQRRCEADQSSLTVALRQLQLTEDHLQRFLAAGRPPQELRLAPCSFGGVVQQVLELVDGLLRHRQLGLTVASQDDAESTLLADAEQLRYVLLNLVLNAADAAGTPTSPAPGLDGAGAPSSKEGNAARAGWIRIEWTVDDEAAVLSVCDSGPGLTPEMEARLFEPFATNKPNGIGLGLPVCHQIISAHGGRLEYSRADEVTCFRVHLPRTASPEAVPTQRPLVSIRG